MAEAFGELHKSLKQAEEWVPILREANADQIMDIIVGLDSAQARVNALRAQGARYPAEEVQRIEMVESALRRHMGRVARVLDGAGISLAAVAAERAQVADGWWWRIRELEAEHRRRTFRAWAIRSGILIAVLAIAVVLYNTVFAPDPLVVARSDAIGSAQQALYEGDYEGALAALDAGLAKMDELSAGREEPPDTVDLLAYRGVVLQTLGREDEAAADFAAAEAQNPEAMYIARVMAYLYVENAEAALADALVLVDILPDHPASYMLLGDAYFATDQRLNADQAYATAEEMSFASEDYASIYVLIKQKRQALWNAAPGP